MQSFGDLSPATQGRRAGFALSYEQFRQQSVRFVVRQYDEHVRRPLGVHHVLNPL
jgi:hypothetical protein